MMNNNKILTVSYGTFSCTLEGFDDSFGTMKAIAEYFRDLAADDRYFGAEPPQPDAEMLARIAEKEVSRRVQAREQDGRIVLSALEDQTDTPAPVAQTVAAAAVAAAPEIVAQEDTAAQPHEVAPAIAETEEAVAETDAADVAQIETEDAEIETTPVDIASTLDVAEEPFAQDIIPDDIKSMISVEESEDESTVTAAIESDLAREEIAEFAEDVFVEPTAEEDEIDIVPGQPDADVEAFFAESAAQTETIDEDEDENDAVAEDVAPAQDAPAPDSIAAKLQRIRAVVAQHEEDDVDEDFLEDEHADTSADAKSSDLISEARAEIEDALSADDEFEAVSAQSSEVEEEADEVSDILSRLQSLEDDDAFIEDKMITEDDDDDASEDTSTEDTVSNLFDEDESTLDVDAEASEAASIEESSTSEPETVSEKADTGKPRTRARVIKVKRADLEAAIQKGDLEEYDDEDDGDEDAAAASLSALDELAPAKRPTTTLSPEAEADLARELAELEADIEAGDDEVVAETTADDAEDEAESEEVPTSAARSRLPSIDGAGSSDVNRLLAETDHQMDEPESATRRDAFAHLRAAVAAKKADSTIEDDDAPKGVVAYREDLAEVVRPRRPVAAASRTERPEEARPAPLKLVAEQRIDIEKPKASGPVRPRRVAAMADATADGSEGDSFADFAADVGATTLPQLLEAAAAYLSFVEGRDQFSRPQLMTKVRQAGGDKGFSREEGLRSFGQLLRAGKIEKIKGGRFTVSDDIGFRPDQRAAG
ncbi:hypothetical protein GV827_02350 [Sulfitobacter sp. JBTF-M27]|uniref:Chemotaxis protein CheA n=2 Tax=Sulfitobacter sediminilitoris TaxID=2698830 RepID=A0A6P0C9P6_9RHOB|nr:hypothetical protein [Sulfitobacter sediminilitoris]